MNSKLIFVTGCFGAPIREEAQRIADRKGLPFLDLDREIEKRDGRSIARICMAAGEHGYRNQEYELVEELTRASDSDRQESGRVIACGDGILYDDQTRQLILEHELVIVGEDAALSDLWQAASKDESTWHAFMKFGSDKEKEEAFRMYHERQKSLFARVREEAAGR